MIKAVLFDFGQTLVDSADGFRSAEKEAKEKIFEDLFPGGAAGDWEIFLSDYRKLRKEFHEKSNFSRRAAWRAVYEKFNHRPDLNRLERWEEEYWARVKRMTEPFPETLDVLETLSVDYQLALITNTQGQSSVGAHRIALFPELERFFQVVVVAGESGTPPKPDPAPFRICLRKLGILPGEAVFVGDDWRIDVGGSRDAGLHPVWLKHHMVQRSWPRVETSLPVITSLEGLFDILSKDPGP
ncbi:MAG: HAD family hydrolase [Desulfobacterales bacterium]|nr:HAD family hydrolase [Desulfobacterales bacterium]